MPGKRIGENLIQLIYYNAQLGKKAKELSEMFNVSLRTVYNIINRAEKENRIDYKPQSGRPKKLSERNERRLIKKIIDNPRTSTRSLAAELNKEAGVAVSYNTIRNTLIAHKYSSRISRKKPLLSSINVEKRLSFALKHVNEPNDFWSDVIFCDETKIMLYYNDGPNRVWRQPLKALENKNITPTVKFGKLSVMVWGCISSQGVGNLVFINGNMDQEQYLDILKQNLPQSAHKFGFGNNFKFYQDNDPKHKAWNVRSWLLYNCRKVIDTPAQSPDLNPIENIWVFLKRRVAKRNPKNKRELVQFIKEEWEKIPEHYNFSELIKSMNRRLFSVIDAEGRHTKY